MAGSWKPTEKQLSTYELLVKKYSKMRKQIIKAHRNLEEITGGRLPSLVVPERHRKMRMAQIRMSGRKIFLAKVKQLRKIVNEGIKGFFKSYKKSYLDLYRTYIIGEDPEAGKYHTMYSEMQIKEMEATDPKMAQFMHDYNKIVTMPPEVFAFLVKSGKLPEFKYVYNELGKGLTFAESYAERMSLGLKQARRIDVKKAGDFLSGKFSFQNQAEIDIKVIKTERRISRYRNKRK